LNSESEDVVSLVPEQTDEAENYDLALAQGQFEFAKTRYIRTVTYDAVSRMISASAVRRAKLTEEIDQLRVVTKTRHEAALERARLYGNVLPHRVGKTWIQPPAPLERVGEFYGSDKLYNMAKKAATEYREARELLIKRRDELAEIERVLREALEDNEALLVEEISSGRGLKYALRRDPLLNMAYEKMRKLEGRAADETVQQQGIGNLEV
jgi:hypothetical protein